ncbi:macro domain-containing protein [Clostridium gasigenes]|uniref:Thoeris protein ThsA Macro domain-containing protein n=1 Tax=Clostridium gasigenes TaxID=94869 RepID=A0A1H0MDJ5_9CLOT|nr:macro domain-containing protein [Clostridium gasigenes]MBB6713734.1 hypothetical protein [Clostridium gasigenes]SDO78385.1 hypothetical protein SAMN04488529_101417 [Clostridium gasigenes]
MRIKLCNVDLLREYLSILAIIGIPFGFFSNLLIINDNNRKIWIGSFIIIMIILYLIVFYKANKISKLKFNINNNRIKIYYGDIFKENGLKVIPFNEYFDTHVDNNIIAKNSLNGKFIIENKLDTSILDNEIESKLNSEKYELVNRNVGKKKKYEIGNTIEVNGEYALTAFTKFDEYNRAYLTKVDYVSFLLRFWKNIDKIYNQRNIVIPLIGSGISRVEGNMKLQDYLEQILNSIKLSGISIPHDCEIKIVLHESVRSYINLYKIKTLYKGES